jgi:diguanylate cyclase (GGDEF)-like protein/PAS domain S-box-containing protein
VGARSSFRPFASRGRRAVVAIIVTFAAFSALSVTLSIWTTARSRNQAAVVESVARQRTLAERYVKEVLLARDGRRTDPATTGSLLNRSATALLAGGEIPEVAGDDDEVSVPRTEDDEARGQLVQARRLARDLTATGQAVLAGRPVTAVRLTAHERLTSTDPTERLRVLASLTSNVSLNAARTIATASDRNIAHAIGLQEVLGFIGLVAALGLGFALVATTRRQTAHFRSLVTSSTDLVLVFGDGGCRYVSDSVVETLGRPEKAVLRDGFETFVHPDDLGPVQAAFTNAEPHEIVFRVHNRFSEWRHLEAHVTDLRADRQIRGTVLNARDITERVELEEQLTRQAFHDGLTSLPNRALFRDRLDQALARSGRSQDAIAVLLLDLDGFKQVNDTLGHDAGDTLLREVALRVSGITRPSDTIARLGGDEFALLLDAAGEQHAVNVADRILRALAEPMRIAERELALGASIGIVVHQGGRGSSEDLIRHADLAMYAAKESGRGRWEIFQDEMTREVGELLGLEHELRLGLQRGEFSLHYQPEVSLDTRAIVGVEALLRWNSPTRGSVPPLSFIPIAEATGLILPLGEWVVREACEQIARWRRDNVLPEDVVMWVNLSAKQLAAGGVSEMVKRTLADSRLPGTCLGLEVTESAIVEDGAVGERARSELQELRELGTPIAIDDFGTGFSSLGQLRRFPVDMLKVDRSFVSGVEHNAKDAAITANLVSLAHALGLIATAEGIESDGQLESLRKLGCDVAQGYLFARPMPPEELAPMLAKHAQDPEQYATT